MNVTIVRHAYLPDVTLGTLKVGGLALATLEEGWISNPFGPGGQRRQPGKRESCVGDGIYALQPHDTPKHPNCWALYNPDLGVWRQAVPPGVPYGRSAILIHTGNSVADTEGCVLIGVRHARDPAGMPMVLESRNAMEQLRAVLGNGSHSLEIRPTAGTSEVNQ
jgi:hypothetical protein